MKILLTALIIALAFAVPISAQKRMSDKEADKLKGKVKTIATEIAKLQNQNGNLVEGTKQSNSIVTYDTDGNRVKQELYDYKGNLFQTSIYSLLDGEKIVKQEIKHYDYDPPLVAIGSSPNSKPRDSRYSYKFKYKFDDKGRRTEEAWYSNDGSLWLRYVSIYDDKGNEVEWFRYTADGKVNGRSISVYNAKGDEIEKTWFRADGSLSEKWSYTYELDSNGNWIKRKSLKFVTKDGKSFFEPYATTYRQISYF